MRIFLSLIVILLGANLLANLLNSQMLELIQERNQTIEKLNQEYQ
jgi:hypothetical protein